MPRRRPARKYDPLQHALAQTPGREVTLTFAQVEAVLGALLPPGARASRGWWANSWGHAQARAWLAAGWRMTAVDFDLGTVTFSRLVGNG